LKEAASAKRQTRTLRLLSASHEFFFKDSLRIIAWVTSIFLVFLSVVAAPVSETYRYAFIFLGLLLWGLYSLRHKFSLHPFHLALFGLALLIHNLGAFGFYRKSFWGLAFDTYVHFYFGLAGALILSRALRVNYRLSRIELLIGVTLLILGVGAIHELIEWASTLILGPERGMLKLNTGDVFDTQKDLLNNLLGALTALALYLPRHGLPPSPDNR
jgi:uncharacterized membrane protein YjdF